MEIKIKDTSEGDSKDLSSDGDSKSRPSKTSFLAYLESLRGIFAMGVVFHHTTLGFKQYLGSFDFILNSVFVNNGSFWVASFFVLAGRVIVWRYLNQQSASKLSLIKSIIKRPFRLMIPCLLSSYLAYLIYISGFYETATYDTIKEKIAPDLDWPYAEYKPSHRNTLMEMIRMISYPEYFPSYPAAVLWTIGYEIYYSFYIYFAVFIYKELPTLFGRISFLSGLLFHSIFFDRPYITFVFGFAISCLDYEGYIEPLRNPPNGTIRNLKIVYCLLVLLYFFNINSYNEYYRLYIIDPYDTYSEVLKSALGNRYLPCLLFLLLEIYPFLQSLLESKQLLFLGKISFSIYLIHGIILPLFRVYLSIVSSLVILNSIAYPLTWILWFPILILVSTLFQTYGQTLAFRLIDFTYWFVFEITEDEWTRYYQQNIVDLKFESLLRKIMLWIVGSLRKEVKSIPRSKFKIFTTFSILLLILFLLLF